MCFTPCVRPKWRHTHKSCGAYWEVYTTLLEIVKIRNLRYFGHAVGVKETLPNTILQGKRIRSIKSRGRRVRQWLKDVKEWTGLSLNEMWREPLDRVARRKRVSGVVPNGLNSLLESLFKIQCAQAQCRYIGLTCVIVLVGRLTLGYLCRMNTCLVESDVSLNPLGLL